MTDGNIHALHAIHRVRTMPFESSRMLPPSEQSVDPPPRLRNLDLRLRSLAGVSLHLPQGAPVATRAVASPIEMTVRSRVVLKFACSRHNQRHQLSKL